MKTDIIAKAIAACLTFVFYMGVASPENNVFISLVDSASEILIQD